MYKLANYQKVITDPDYTTEWKKTIQTELKCFKRNKIWVMTDLLAEWKLIGLKQVFKVKYRQDRTVEKFKG